MFVRRAVHDESVPRVDKEARRRYHREYERRRLRDDPAFREQKRAAARRHQAKRRAKLRAMIRSSTQRASLADPELGYRNRRSATSIAWSPPAATTSSRWVSNLISSSSGVAQMESKRR